MAGGAALVNKKASDPSGALHRQGPAPQPHRQGGLWNFLTWSFFLSQVVAAESFIGSRAHAEGASDASRGADGSSAQAATGAGQPLLAAHVGRPDEAGAPAVATSTQLQPEHVLAHDGASAHQGIPGGAPISLGVHAMGTAVPADAAEPGIECQGALQSTHLDSAADASPAVVLDLATLPAIGAIGDTIGGIVSPILGPLDNTIGSLDAILDHALTTTMSLAAPVADVADTVVQPIGDAVDHVVAPLDALLDPALSSTASLTAPVAIIADVVLQPAATIVDHATAPIADLLSVQGAVASAGTIVVPEAPVLAVLPFDDLFSKGSYTDYNLTLNSEPIGGASLQPGGDGTLHVADLRVGDAAHDDHDSTMAQHSPPTSALDELHLRGFGEGVGLV